MEESSWRSSKINRLGGCSDGGVLGMTPSSTFLENGISDFCASVRYQLVPKTRTGCPFFQDQPLGSHTEPLLFLCHLQRHHNDFQHFADHLQPLHKSSHACDLGALHPTSRPKLHMVISTSTNGSLTSGRFYFLIRPTSPQYVQQSLVHSQS